MESAVDRKGLVQGFASSIHSDKHIASPQRLNGPQLRQLAIRQHQQGQTDQAISLYQAFLKLQPNDTAIWCNLGAALRKQKQYQSAVNCYRRALEVQPNDLTAMGNLGNALKDLHRLEEAIAIHQHLVAQKPNDVQALMNYACALRENGQFADALDQLNNAKMVEPKNAGVEWERAQNLLYLGRYSEGWKAYEARWHTGDLPKRDYGCPQWCGEPIANKTILLHAEQGYGDTILAARYVRLVKESVGPQGRVILQCKPELHRLFKSIGADQLITPEQTPPSIDVHCPLMSLMGCFDTQPDTIPPTAQLHIPDEAKLKFAYLNSQHPQKIKVGIVWSGSVTFKNNDNRALPLSAFLPLAELPNVRLYSLQKGPRQSELQENGAQAFIHDLGSLCDDFADTAAAIEHLDVIVMTDSSVAHLAGSLNKLVINLLPKVPYWLYALDVGTTPWYASMQLLTQEVPCWRQPIAQTELRLRKMYAEKSSTFTPPYA
jgi:Flp pilus assembly protein TadD